MTSPQHFPIPVNYFSMVLGLSAFGLSWRYGAAQGWLPPTFGEHLLGFSALLWLVLIVVYIYKWLKFRQAAQAELAHLIVCCFISLIPITTILIGISALPYTRPIALVLIIIGIIGQLLFAAYRAAGLWRGIHAEAATTPVVYLPAVATNFVSASAMGALGWHDWGMLFWGAGIFSWLSLEPAILSRLRNLEPVAAPTRGIIGIQLAPAFVGCGAYLANNGGRIDLPVQMMIGYGLLQLIYLIRLLPWIFEHRFTMSFWSFSFGLAAMAGCGLHLYQQLGQQGLGWLGWPMFAFSTIALIGLVAGTLWLIAKGKFLVKAV